MVKLTAEKYAFMDEFYKMKEEVKNAEALKRTAIKIMSEESLERTTTRTQGMEL